MSEIQVGQINSTDGSTAITTSSGNTTVANNLTVTGGFVPSTQIGGRRNLIINGAMQVAQRGTSVSNNTSGGYTTLDRWQLFQNLGGLNISQSTDAPAGFNNSIKYEVSTTGTASGTKIVTPVQGIEGYSTAHLNWGSSDAQSVTFSFWVKSSVTGTYAVWIRNTDDNRYQPKEFSISVANTWEKKTLTFAGDTSGTWNKTNGLGMYIGVCLDVADRIGTADVWQSSNAFSTSNQTHFMANSGATFYITGVQLEVGTVATPFEHRSFGEELALCQRYFQTTQQYAWFVGYSSSTTQVVASIPLSNPMRATPSLGMSSWSWYAGSVSSQGASTNTPQNISYSAGNNNMVAAVDGFSGLTQDVVASIRPNNTLTLDAEL